MEGERLNEYRKRYVFLRQTNTAWRVVAMKDRILRGEEAGE